MNTRIATIVYAALTLLAVATAATAKGYASDLAEFAFVVVVSAVGLFLAHFWSQLLARRLTGDIDGAFVKHEAMVSSVMLVPAALMMAIAAVVWFVTDSIDVAVTSSMIGLTVVLFAYTWLGTRAFLWSLGTAAVAVLMIVFKVVA